MSRRTMLTVAAAGCAGMLLAEIAPAGDRNNFTIDASLARDWLARWEKGISGDEGSRYCGRETGEEIGWLISPYLNGYYYGYLATGDTKWIDRLIQGAEAWISRGTKEPDGFIGWPKEGGASTGPVESLLSDSLLGEAMGLKPLVLMAGHIRKTPALTEKYGATFNRYLELAENMFAKWDARGSWRDVGVGGVWVVSEFGIDPKTGQWTSGYDSRATVGFTMPANKQNLIALWLLALHDVTGKPIYRERAERWFRVMKSRMRLRDGNFYVWNYWDPAGSWDYKPDHSTCHWVGVHPNGGYYASDLAGIVAGFEHELVFDQQDIDRLIATNRDYMWNGNLEHASFRSIDGGPPDPRWKNTPGLLWEALLRYDSTLRKIFLANHDPGSWGGLTSTPKYLAMLKNQSIRSQ